MNNNKLIKFFIPNQNIYLWIIGVLAVILFKYNIVISIITFVILIYLVYYKVISTNESEKRWKEIVENLTLDIDAATQNILLELPFPLLIIKKTGEIIWYNSSFREVAKVDKNILSMKIMDLFTDIDMNKVNELNDKKEAIHYTIEDKAFKVFSNTVESKNNDDILMLYWLDITDYEVIKRNYISEMPILAHIQIDNYDEVVEDSSESYRPLITAVIDRKINTWANELDAFIIKYETDKYIMVFEQKHLSALEEKRFNILDSIRETQSGNKLPVTLSIGIGSSKKFTSFIESQRLSKSALDIALARGGDQAVVKKDEIISYYGGKSQALEKRTKVKARVKAHGIRELIQNSDKVYIIGHQIPDIDSLGAALGIYRCSKFLGKEVNIILNKSNPSIDILYKELLASAYVDLFITSETALKNMTDNTLVIAVDVHRKNFVEDSDIIDVANKIIIIDHHRRGSDFIEKAEIIYLEPYASSTSELVAEIIEYIGDNVKLETIEATALLAGIYMDTKNFSFRTGVRTFEAASYLKRKGADINKCKQLLKDDREVFVAKVEAVKKAEITEDKIAIALINYQSEKIKLIVAQTADELLNLQDIEASFVIAQDENSSFISGRSLGEINVQLILEKLGGGGHLSNAGAQLLDTNIEEAKVKLKEEIKKYIMEGEE